MILKYQKLLKHQPYYDYLSKWFCSSFLGSKILSYIQEQLVEIWKLYKELRVVVAMDQSTPIGKFDSRKKMSPQVCSTSPLHLRLNAAAERRTLIDNFRSSNSNNTACFPAILGGGFRIEAYRPPNMPIPQRYRPLAKSSPGRIHTVMPSTVRDLSKSPGRERPHTPNCPHQGQKGTKQKLKCKSNSSGKVTAKTHEINAKVSNTDTTDSKPRGKKKHNRKANNRGKVMDGFHIPRRHHSGTPATAISLMKTPSPGKIPPNDSQAVLNTIGQCLDSLRKHRCLSHPRMSSCPFSHADKQCCMPSSGSNKMIEIKKPLVITTPITNIETKWRHRRATSDSPPTKIEATLPIVPDKIQLSISTKSDKTTSEVKSNKGEKIDFKKDENKEDSVNRKETQNVVKLEIQNHPSSDNKDVATPTDSLSSSEGSTIISSSPVDEHCNSAQLTESVRTTSTPSSHLDMSGAEAAEKPEQDTNTAVASRVTGKRSDPQISISSVSRDQNAHFESKMSIASDSSNTRRPSVLTGSINTSKLPEPATPTTDNQCPALHFPLEKRTQAFLASGHQSQQPSLSTKTALNSYDKSSSTKRYSHPDLQHSSALQSQIQNQSILSSQHSSAPSSRPVSRQSCPQRSQQSTQYHSTKNVGDEAVQFPSNQLLTHPRDSYTSDHAKKHDPKIQSQYPQNEDSQELSEQLEQFLPGQEVEYVSDHDGVYTSDQPEQYTADENNYESEQPNQYESDNYSRYPDHPLSGSVAQSDLMQNQFSQGHKTSDQECVLPTQENSPDQERNHSSFQRDHMTHTSGNSALPQQAHVQGQSHHLPQKQSGNSKHRAPFGDSRLFEHSVRYQLSKRPPAHIGSTSLESVSQESAGHFDDTSVQSSLSSISSDTSMSELVSRLTTLSTQTKHSYPGPDYERSTNLYGADFNNNRDANVRIASCPTRQKPLLPMRQGPPPQTESNSYPVMNNFNTTQGTMKPPYPQFSSNTNPSHRAQSAGTTQNGQPGYSFSPFQYNRNPRTNGIHDSSQPNFSPLGNRQRRRFSPYSVQNDIPDHPQKDVNPPRSHPVSGGYSISKANPEGFTIKFPHFLAPTEFVSHPKQGNDRNASGETRPKVYDGGTIKLPPTSTNQYVKYSDLPTFSQATLSFDPSSDMMSDNSKDNGYPSTSNDYDYTEMSDDPRVQNNMQNGATQAKSKTWIPAASMGGSAAQPAGTFPKIAPGMFPGLTPGIHPGLIPGMPSIPGMPNVPGVPGVPGNMYAGIMPMYSGMYPSIFMYPGMPPMQCPGMWHSGKGQPMAAAPAAAPSCMPTGAVMFPYFPYSMPMFPWNLPMGMPGHPSFPNMPIVTFDPCTCAMAQNMCSVPQPVPDVRNMRTPPPTPPMTGISQKPRSCTIPETPEPVMDRSANGGCVGRMPLRYQPFVRTKDKMT